MYACVHVCMHVYMYGYMHTMGYSLLAIASIAF